MPVTPLRRPQQQALLTMAPPLRAMRGEPFLAPGMSAQPRGQLPRARGTQAPLSPPYRFEWWELRDER
ncbi:hypothetical protein VTG60DRAFT_6056 [Thermothelomyces hinnuleus]